MRVLVTGGAGYIGSVMVRMLTDEGHDVLVLDDLSKGHRQAVHGVDIAVVDLEDLPAVTESCRAFKPEACLHFAARSLVAESVADPLAYFRTNVGGGLNLVSALSEAGCGLLVFSSTAATYGIPEGSPITEDSRTAPINPYGLSKLLFEQILDQLSLAGSLRYVSLRYFNAAGADVRHDLGEDHDPETHLIPRVIAAALGTEPRVVIYGNDYPTPDGTCIRDYIHVLDLARAHLLALEYLSSGGTSAVFNLGNGKGFSVREVIDVVRRASGRDFEVVDAERREGDPPVLVASSERIMSRLGWKPEFADLEGIVETAWQWHSRHPDGYQ
ncbi:MAG: UDP-glucose 4-epimerase GalE [Actinobacteria bacterium]|nr:UDP-glucose 4-epimerase GalE [Actinomycetota bacterium]